MPVAVVWARRDNCLRLWKAPLTHHTTTTWTPPQPAASNVSGTARVTNKAVLPPVQLVSACGGQFALYSRRSPAKETSNQDVAAVVSLSKESGAVLVADGLGGMRTGEMASCIAAFSVCETIQQLPTEGNLLPPIVIGTEDPFIWQLARLGAEMHDGVLPPGPDDPNHSGDLQSAILNGLEHANQRILSEAAGSAAGQTVR